MMMMLLLMMMVVVIGTDVVVMAARHLQPLISILTPIYWTTAVEVGHAVNGYTLTQGNFRREVQVEFATGKCLLSVSQQARVAPRPGARLWGHFLLTCVPIAENVYVWLAWAAEPCV